MAQIVSCHHCGAPHRPARGQSRFTCAWCGGENARGDTSTALARGEQVIVDGRITGDGARSFAETTLRRRGVPRARVVAGPPRWLGQWQVTAEDGQTFERCAHRDPTRLESALDLPTARYRPLEADESDGPDPRRIEVDEEEIVAAARATFDRPDQPVGALRLVWTQICDVRAHTPAGVVEGIVRAGADEVIFAPLPAGATAAPAAVGRRIAYAGFAVTALVAGSLVGDPLGRGLALGTGLACALVLTALPRRAPRRST